MRVYYPGARGDHSLYVAPAADPRCKGEPASEWLGQDGAPRTLEVRFRGGVADVPDSMGRYLVATGMAKRTNLIIPKLLA